MNHAVDTDIESGRTNHETQPRHTWILPVAVGLIAAAIALARITTSGKFGKVMWAEDGYHFLSCAVDPGGLSCIFEPIESYLLVVPRIVSMPMGVIDISNSAAWAEVVSCTLAGITAAFVTWRARTFPFGPWVSGATGLSIVMLAIFGAEVLGSIANAQWFLVAIALWALLPKLASKSSDGTAIVDTIAVLLVGLTSPGTFCLAPFALWRYFASKPGSRSIFRPTLQQAPAVAFGIAALIQVLVIATHRSGRSVAPLTTPIEDRFGAIVEVFGQVFVSPFTHPSEEVRMYGWWVIGALVVAGVVALVVASPRQRMTILASIGSFALLCLISIIPYGAAPRYAYLGLVLLGPAVAVIVSVFAERFGIAGKVAAALAAVIVLIPFVAIFQWSVPGTLNVDWRTSASQARAVCKKKPDSRVAVQLAPEGWGVVELPCSFVLRKGR